MSSDNKYRQLVDQLFAKTEEGKIEWRETAETDTFQVSFAHYSITLAERRTTPRNLTYVVSILNSEGRRVDTFSDDFDWDPGYKKQLSELYQKARRQALSADKALDEILSQLSDTR